MKVEDLIVYGAPTSCPFCGSKLEVVNDIHLSCLNDDCEGVKSYLFAQGVGCLDLFGVGGATVDLIWEAGIHTATDLLNPDKFNKNILIASGKFTDGRSLDKLFEEIEKVNELELKHVIMMLGFKGMGWTTATQVANMIARIDYSFSGLEKTVVDGFEPGKPKRKLVDEAIAELSKFITIIYPKSKAGITFVEMTGSPKDAGIKTKEEFLELIEPFKYEHGKLSEAKYLVTDDLNSKTSKMDAAKKKGIEILTYGQFIDKFCQGAVVNKPTQDTTKKVANNIPVTIVPKSKGLF